MPRTSGDKLQLAIDIAKHSPLYVMYAMAFMVVL